MSIAEFIGKTTSTVTKGWTYVVGPFDPNNEKFNVRTRFKMALLSFFVLTGVFLVAFWTAIKSADVERTELFLSFAQHVSYVLGAVVASFVGMESVFPSIGGYGWRGRGHGQGGYGGHRKAKADDPPVGPDQGDEQVD